MNAEQKSEIALRIANEEGLHSRPADLFVRTAKLYRSKITVAKDGTYANAKNIIKVILLNAAPGEEIVITAVGPDAEEAVHDLSTLVESRFEIVNQAVRT